MGTAKEQSRELILKQVINPLSGAHANPAVLSCGGIYIPHRGPEEKVLCNIITTLNREEPIKVVMGVKPRNDLYEVLLKESMN